MRNWAKFYVYVNKFIINWLAFLLIGSFILEYFGQRCLTAQTLKCNLARFSKKSFWANLSHKNAKKGFCAKFAHLFFSTKCDWARFWKYVFYANLGQKCLLTSYSQTLWHTSIFEKKIFFRFFITFQRKTVFLLKVQCSSDNQIGL